jgi:Tfp pilus assembly protein PilE
MTGKTHNRLGFAIVVVLVAVVASFAISATAFGSKSSETPAWEKALMARGDALNRHYGLGKYAGTRTKSAHRAQMPAWEKALMARGDALNRHYKLGKYAAR